MSEQEQKAIPDLGRVGAWTFEFDRWPMLEVQRAVAQIEELGFRSVWVPEQVERYGREALSHAAILLAASERLVVANSIARIGVRSPAALVAAQHALADAYPDRHLLGLGGVRAGEPTGPVTQMRSYLDAMDEVESVSPPPRGRLRRLLGAYGPAMLRLAQERTAGANTWLVSVEHTRTARAVLGVDAYLAVAQPVVLETDPVAARAGAREYVRPYLSTPFNVAKFRRLGFGDDDLLDGGSDRLLEAVMCWGNIDAVADRIAAHLEAGADTVAVEVVGTTCRPELIERLRPIAELDGLVSR